MWGEKISLLIGLFVYIRRDGSPRCPVSTTSREIFQFWWISEPILEFHLFVLYARGHEVPKSLYDDTVKKPISIIHWRTMLSTIEVTVGYHLVTHHPVSCNRMSYYLFLLPTEWRCPQWQSSSAFCRLPCVYRGLLEPTSIDRVLMSDLPIWQMLNRNVRAKIEGVPVAFLSLIPKYTYKQITPYRLETLIIYAANLSRDYFNFFF